MKVYIVFNGDLVEGVFADEDAAKDYADQIQKVSKVYVGVFNLLYGQQRYPAIAAAGVLA